MTAAGPRRGPESGVFRRVPVPWGTPAPGLRVDLGVASGSSKAQGSRGQMGSEAEFEVGFSLSPPELQYLPRHQVRGVGGDV